MPIQTSAIVFGIYCVLLSSLANGDSPVLAIPTTAPSELSITLQTLKSGDREIVEVIRPGDLKTKDGKSYVAKLQRGRPGDKDGGSQCVLLEDGKPLEHPHTRHHKISELGKGRYSHWTQSLLWFSASDSSDPRTNGRRYELVSQVSVSRKSAIMTAKAHSSAVRLSLGDETNIVAQRVTLRNLDPRRTVAPHLKRHGDPDLTSVDSILKSILREDMTDEQKAIAIWQVIVDWRYHDYPAEPGAEIHDPIKLINVYGYGFCDDCAQVFCGLTHAAGIKARVHGLSRHVVAEAFFDNAWHMFDPDHAAIYRTDSGEIASVAHLEQHPELITATPRDPIGTDTDWVASVYTTRSDNYLRVPDLPESRPIRWELAPGDKIEFDFSRPKLFHRRGFPDHRVPTHCANGTLIQNRKLDSLPRDGQGRLFEVHCPYVLVDGNLSLEAKFDAPQLKVDISRDRHDWTELEFVNQDGTRTFGLDGWIKKQTSAVYDYWIRIRSQDGGDPANIVPRLQQKIEFQFAPKSHAQLGAGENLFDLIIDPTDGHALIDWQGMEVEWVWEETSLTSSSSTTINNP